MKATPIAIYQGDDYTATVNVTTNGTALDLTGFTAPTAQLRRDVADNDTTIDATFTCSITLPSSILMSLARTVTTPLTGCYQWDLQVTDPTGHIVTIARGPAHVTQEVTR